MCVYDHMITKRFPELVTLNFDVVFLKLGSVEVTEHICRSPRFPVFEKQ